MSLMWKRSYARERRFKTQACGGRPFREGRPLTFVFTHPLNQWCGSGAEARNGLSSYRVSPQPEELCSFHTFVVTGSLPLVLSFDLARATAFATPSTATLFSPSGWNTTLVPTCGISPFQSWQVEGSMKTRPCHARWVVLDTRLRSSPCYQCCRVAVVICPDVAEFVLHLI